MNWTVLDGAELITPPRHLTTTQLEYSSQTQTRLEIWQVIGYQKRNEHGLQCLQVSKGSLYMCSHTSEE